METDQKKIKMPQSKIHSLKPIEYFTNRIHHGDTLQILKTIPDESVDCVVTSPPYWALRDYEVKGQIGLEPNVDEYLDKLIAVFDEIKRVLKPGGTCWVNFGDTYANKTKGVQRNKPQSDKTFNPLSLRASVPKLNTSLNIPPKSLCLVPVRFAVRMIERGWILRNEIIWHKPNVTPQSIKDRFTIDFEKIFFFVKQRHYYFHQQFEPLKNPERLQRRFLNPKNKHKYTPANYISINPAAIEKSRPQMLERGRNKRAVWRIGTSGFKGKHYAVYPEKLMETPIKAGCPAGGIVLDPFIGSGTTAVVARRLGRQYIGIELNPKYVAMARKRVAET